MRFAAFSLFCYCFTTTSLAQPHFRDTSLDLGPVAQGARIDFYIYVSNPDTTEYNLNLEHICGCTEFVNSHFALPSRGSIKIPVIYHSSGNKGQISRGFYVNYSNAHLAGRQKISFSANVDTVQIFNKPILDTATCFVFKQTTIDAGNIPEGDQYEFLYTFNNCSKKPLLIQQVNSSCGCVTPNWSKEPVMPGETGTIKATYNSMSRPGRFQKTLTVYFTGTTRAVVLTLKGNVI